MPSGAYYALLYVYLIPVGIPFANSTNARPSSSAQSLLKTGLVCAPRAPPAGTLLLHTAHTRHAQPPIKANMARPSVENASILCAHSDTIECVA